MTILIQNEISRDGLNPGGIHYTKLLVLDWDQHIVDSPETLLFGRPIQNIL